MRGPSPRNLNFNAMAPIHLTRRERLLLSSLASSRAHAQTNNVHDEIREPARHAPLRMQFRGFLARGPSLR